MLNTDGSSITIATTLPLLKSGTLPSICVYRTLAMTSYFPPTDAGIPKSVKQRKNAWINDAAKVPISGLKIVIINVENALSPINLDTTMNFLSMYPIVLLISMNEIGRV